MKKLMIVAAFGLVFSVLSVMPAKADSPRNDNRYENHDRGYERHDIRNDRRDIRNDRRDIRNDRRDIRFDRHEDFHRDYRCR